MSRRCSIEVFPEIPQFYRTPQQVVVTAIMSRVPPCWTINAIRYRNERSFRNILPHVLNVEEFIEPAICEEMEASIETCDRLRQSLADGSARGNVHGGPGSDASGKTLATAASAYLRDCGLCCDPLLLVCEILRTFACPLRRNPGCPFGHRLVVFAAKRCLAAISRLRGATLAATVNCSLPPLCLRAN
jgi:hypothetical protein